MRSLIHKLFELGAVKFGTFTLKSGILSPVYIDLRLSVSNPKLLASIGEAMYASVKACSFDLVCGVPYTALPFATALSLQHNIPMVLRRKEKKEYGTGKIIEGIFKPGERCLVVEDVVTSGKSIFETIEDLNAEGLVVKDVVVFVDREQGGARHLSQKGYHLHSICTITAIVTTLLEDKKINEETAFSVLSFIRENQT